MLTFLSPLTVLIPLMAYSCFYLCNHLSALITHNTAKGYC